MKTLAAIATLGLLLGSSAAMAGAREDIMAADRAFSKLSVEKGVPLAFWTYSARSARLYGQSGPPKVGKAATAPKALPGGKSVLSWSPTAAGASADGTLGWSDGVWKLTGPDGTDTGHYLTVWVREDGQWRMQADMGTTDPRPKAP